MGFWGGHQGPVWQRQIPRWNLFQWKDLLKTNPLPGLQFLMKIYIGINNKSTSHVQTITLQVVILHSTHLTGSMGYGQLCNFLPDQATLPLVFPEQVAGPP